MSECEHMRERAREPKQWKYWQLMEYKQKGRYWHLKRICRRCHTIQTKRELQRIIDLDNPEQSQRPSGTEAWIGIKRKIGQSGEAQAREL